MTDFSDLNLNFSIDDGLNLTLGNEIGCELEMELEMGSNNVSSLTRILSILGLILCAVGIIGNILSIIILCKHSMNKLSTYSYLLGLSICDELSLTLTVFIFLDYLSPYLTIYLNCTDRVKIVNFQKILLFYIYPIVSSTQALSVWITLAFTVDRYLYVCKPFLGVKYCTRKRASMIIVLLYILAAIYSVPQFIERTYVKENIFGIDRIFLSYTEIGRSYYFMTIYHLFIYSVFVTLIPFCIIIILNGFLVYNIFVSRQRHRKMSNSMRHSSEEIKKEQQVTFCCFTKQKIDNNLEEGSEPCIYPKPNLRSKQSVTSIGSGFNFSRHLRNDVNFMLIGLVVVFFICQAPSTILRLITFKNMSLFFKPLYTSTLDISNFLVVCNSTVNCILYVMLGKKFRAEFFKTFCPKFCQKKNINHMGISRYREAAADSSVRFSLRNRT